MSIKQPAVLWVLGPSRVTRNPADEGHLKPAQRDAV